MKTPSFVAAGLSVIALAACGSPDAQAPAAGGAALSSLEPIDAVPLPLDDSSPLDTPPVAAPTAKPAEKADADKADAGDVAAKPEDTTAVVETDARPPRVVITPRAPAASPTVKPTPEPTHAEPERPVLNF